MTDAKRAEEIQRGIEAKQLLDSPLLTEAFDRLEAKYTAEWASSPIPAAEHREIMYAHLQSVKMVRLHLQQVLQTGKMAEIQRERDLKAKR